MGVNADPRLGLGFGHEQHELVGRLVRDIPSGFEGVLMAVVREEVPTHSGTRTTRRAYIRPQGGGVELPVSVKNIIALAVPTADTDAPNPQYRWSIQ